MCAIPGWAIRTLSYKEGYDSLEAKGDSEGVLSILPRRNAPSGESMMANFAFGSKLEVWTGQHWFSGTLNCDYTGAKPDTFVVLKDVQSWSFEWGRRVEKTQRMVFRVREIRGMALIKHPPETPEKMWFDFHKLPFEFKIPVGSKVEFVADDKLHLASVYDVTESKITRDTKICLRGIFVWNKDPNDETVMLKESFSPAMIYHARDFQSMTVVQGPQGMVAKAPVLDRKFLVCHLINTQADAISKVHWDIFADLETLEIVSQFEGFGGYYYTQKNQRSFLGYRRREFFEQIESIGYQLMTTNVVKNRVEYIFAKDEPFEEGEDEATRI
jgi:hypothetical protein